MKLRCSSDQIRLRLRKSDIETLQRNGSLEERIPLPGGGQFGFAIRFDGQANEAGLRWEDGLLLVSLPEKQARQWILSDEVGIEAFLATSKQDALHLAVEKDFPCQHQPTQNPEDTFHELSREDRK